MIQNQNIREEIENVDWNNYDSVIDFYDRNALYFENITNYIKREEIYELANIKISYILAIEKKGHYTKASNLLHQVKILIEKLKGTESFEKVNEKYMFASGVISQRLKKYEESQRYFSKLIKIDPENDLYKNWYESNKEWLSHNKLKIIGYIGTAIIFGSLVFGDVIALSRELRLKLDIIGILMILGGFYGHLITKYIKGLDKKCHTTKD